MEGLWDWRNQKFKEQKEELQQVAGRNEVCGSEGGCIRLLLEVPISSLRVAVSELDIWVPACEETKEKGQRIEWCVWMLMFPRITSDIGVEKYNRKGYHDVFPE